MGMTRFSPFFDLMISTNLFFRSSDDGVPRSLGVLSGTGSGELTIQQPVQQLIQDGATLAVSLEPAGGSPAGAPTGPVIASGKLQSF